jgi:hypothetical protein
MAARPARVEMLRRLLKANGTRPAPCIEPRTTRSASTKERTGSSYQEPARSIS